MNGVLEKLLYLCGALAIIVGGVKLLPSVWRFICIAGQAPSHLNEIARQLPKLDKLDQIQATAEEARDIATETLDEWKGSGATIVEFVRRNETRVESLERDVKTIRRRLQHLEDRQPIRADTKEPDRD